ncbi:hypothetical protein SAY86_031890 [Trapa natans]|uniref:Uncharacterized protein n=1 Tax=Trapa natans TaxID=22666 RepID=A0AAN7R6F9_TRANT|nr:hypothetical protein SAY86_031890 [Trapa natans]
MTKGLRMQMECFHLELLVFKVEISGSCDEDISNHNLNLKQGNSVNWMKKLPSIPKNGLRFRHAIETELKLIDSIVDITLA